MEMVAATGAINRRAKLVKSLPPANQHPTIYRPDALPVARPTVSKTEGKISANIYLTENTLSPF